MPNAFATGRKPEVSAIAVTSGLLKRLNRDELQGVVAHEIAHVKNLDVRFMTIAAVMLGSIVLLADLFFRMLWFGGGRRRGSGGGQGNAVVLLVAVAAAILAPIFAQLLYFACSRKREYLADASAARFTRYPDGLASALEKISGDLVTSLKSKKKKDVQRALAPMYIINPLQASAKAVGLFSTHPPAAKRIKILRAMGGNAGWIDYERAFKEVTGGKSSGLDRKTLASEQSIAARAPSAAPDAKKSAAERGREVADLIDRMVSYIIIGCPCGVRIKVPPQYKRPSVQCTRCGRDHAVDASLHPL
jgi:heat shock protein HtpX